MKKVIMLALVLVSPFTVSAGGLFDCPNGKCRRQQQQASQPAKVEKIDTQVVLSNIVIAAPAAAAQAAQAVSMFGGIFAPQK
jgi:hypothetical protein